MEAKLVVVGGDIKASEINLKLPAIIGRGRDAAITLGHALVSRQHCEIFEDDGRLMVKDLGSLNGTFVDNERITECELPPGHLLTVGTVTFRAVYGDVPAAMLPPKKARTDTEIPDGTVYTPKSQAKGASDLDTEMVEEVVDFETFEEPLAEVDVEDVPAEEMPMFLDVGEPVPGPPRKPQATPPAPTPVANQAAAPPTPDAEALDDVEEVLEFSDLADLGLDDVPPAEAWPAPKAPEAPAAPEPVLPAPVLPAPVAAAPPPPAFASPPEPVAAASSEPPVAEFEALEDVVEEIGDVEMIDELDVVEMLEEPEAEPASPAAVAPPAAPARPVPAAAKAPAAVPVPKAPEKAAAPATTNAPAKNSAPASKTATPAAGSGQAAASAPDEDLDDFFNSLQ